MKNSLRYIFRPAECRQFFFKKTGVTVPEQFFVYKHSQRILYITEDNLPDVTLNILIKTNTAFSDNHLSTISKLSHLYVPITLFTQENKDNKV